MLYYILYSCYNVCDFAVKLKHDFNWKMLIKKMTIFAKVGMRIVYEMHGVFELRNCFIILTYSRSLAHANIKWYNCFANCK